MISIFLDESGDFENKEYKMKFIGGLIYTGEDLEEERIRLEEFFKKLCIKLSISYPNDIHTTELSYGNKGIQKAIREGLMDYIRRNGKYHFTYMICGNNRKTYIKNTSNIVEEETASNLYDNMVANLVQNLLFYNPYLKDKKYSLNITTRVAVVNMDDKSRMDEYEKLGYQCRLLEDEKRAIYYLNNNASIKAAISSIIITNRINRDIEIIDLNVGKANYYKSDRDRRMPTTPLLYAADIACDIIKHTIAEVSDPDNKYISLKRKLDNINKRDLYIYETVRELESISGNKAFAWVYDDIDGLWADLNLAEYRKDLLAALDYLYEIKVNSSSFSKFYYDFWCREIMNNLHLIFSPDELSLYISKIETYCLQKDKSKYEKGLFIAEKIERILMPLNIRNKDYYIFKLKDILLRGYNHRGDTINGHRCIEICREKRDYADTHEYVSFLNRSLQTYANEFNYDKCIETAKDIECYLDILKETEEEISQCLDKKLKGNIQRGKLLSSLGQFYSFKKDKEKALSYFTKALYEFEGSDNDIETTTSYILHLAVESKDYDLYCKYANKYWEYFDVENIYDLEDIFEKIIEKRNRFSLYLYLKSIDAFYVKSIKNKLWNRILEYDYTSNGFEMVHPWELIYKYMAIISLKLNFANIAENRISRIDEIADLGETIRIININSRIEYYILDSQINNRCHKDGIDKQLESMMDILDKHPNIKDVFKPIITKEGKIEVDGLKTIITYMYR